MNISDRVNHIESLLKEAADECMNLVDENGTTLETAVQVSEAIGKAGAYLSFIPIINYEYTVPLNTLNLIKTFGSNKILNYYIEGDTIILETNESCSQELAKAWRN